MRKVYWICLIDALVIAFLDVLFSMLGYTLLVNIATLVMLVLVLIIVIIYFGFVKFKCQKCGAVFKGNKFEMFIAPHTLTKRKMYCPVCKERMWCFDIFEKSPKDK